MQYEADRCFPNVVFVTGGDDSFMARIDMAVVTAKTIPDWSINSEIYGMKLCRLLGLEKVLNCGTTVN